MSHTMRPPRRPPSLTISNLTRPSHCHSRSRVRCGSSAAATTSTKATSPPSSASTTTTRSSTNSKAPVVGQWPNSFEPVVFDSRYIGHYRDPSKHDLHLPISRRARAAWFTPSKVNSIVSNSNIDNLTSSSTSTSLHPSLQTSSNSNSKVRDARHEMERRWGARDGNTDPGNSSGFSDNYSAATLKTSKTTSQSTSSGHSGGASRKSTAPPLTALLMPGSGSQYVGMTTSLERYKAARETWEEAEHALAHFEKWRKDLKLHELPELQHLNLLEWPVWQKERSEKELQQIVKNGPQDELTRSSNSQPAICITSIALLRTFEQDFGIPLSANASFFAGHSSGEYSACVASGAISFTEGVHLTRLHGLLTSRALQLSSLKTYSDHEATDEQRAQMSAIMLQGDSTADQVREIIKRVRAKYEGNAGLVEVASYNSSRQIVLSGSRAGVLRACEKLENEHIAARAADLPVFAPFHCSFMAPAAVGMTHAWNNGINAKAPRAPIVSNLDAGLIVTPERLKRDIVASIHKPVLWSSALDVMREQGVTRYVFVGPGKALANLARKEHKTGRWTGWDELEIGTVATEGCMQEAAELCQDLAGQHASSQSPSSSAAEVQVSA